MFMVRTYFLSTIAKDTEKRYSVDSNVTLCPEMFARITSREIVPTGRIFPSFFSAHDRSRTSFAIAFVCVSGNGKGEFLVVARVRFLVKHPFLCWQSACVNTLPHLPATSFLSGQGLLLFQKRETKGAETCERQPPSCAGVSGRTGGRGRGR